MIIYDINCINGHKFEGWFHDRQAWLEQSAKRLVCCPVCGSSSVEVAPSSIAIKTRSSTKSAKKENDEKEISPAQALHLLHHYIKSNFEDVGNKFAEVALKMHYGEEEKRNIHGAATPQEEADLKQEGISFVKIPLPKLDS